MHDHSIHRVRPDAYHQVWDRDIESALEVEPGMEVGFEVRDASDEQLDSESTAADVAVLDVARVNPICGQPCPAGRRARGRDPRVRPARLRLDRDHLWLRPVGRGVDQPWLRISRVDAEQRAVIFSERVTLPYEPFPGTYNVCTGVAPDLMEATRQATHPAPGRRARARPSGGVRTVLLGRRPAHTRGGRPELDGRRVPPG